MVSVSRPVMEDAPRQQVVPAGSLTVQGAVIFGVRIILCHGMDSLIPLRVYTRAREERYG